jgi:hypothetical protein
MKSLAKKMMVFYVLMFLASIGLIIVLEKIGGTGLPMALPVAVSIVYFVKWLRVYLHPTEE